MGRLAAASGLRREVEAAARWGISLKRLNGWEPAEVTDHEYDEAGRLVRSTTRREVEWDADERAWALALIEYEASKCPGCGGQWSETTSPDAEYGWHVPPPIRCHKCTALAAAQEGDERHHPQALFWTAERR